MPVAKEFDVVIVGSGAGGGTAAKELSALCREGLRVAVLEWGPRFGPEDLQGGELERAQRLYFGGGGLLSRDMTMTFAAGKAYGGSTVVYTGTSLAIEPETVARWRVPGLDASDLERRCSQYLAENGARALAPELLNDNNRLFEKGCRALGYDVRQFPVNVRGCQGAGCCNLGCPHGAKQGTHRVQLPEAERNGVTVVTGCRVERVEDRTVYGRVEDPGFGRIGPWPPGLYRIRARVVVLAAGALHTPALMLRSGFGSRLSALGRYFTCHPALILAAQHDRAITNFAGHPKSFYCGQFAQSRRFLLETCMYFPFTTAKSLAGFGAEHAAMMSRMDRLQMILALALDEARPENRVTAGREGEPVVDYALSERVLQSLTAAMRAAARVFFAAGALRVHAPASRSFFIERAQAEKIDELVTREYFLTGKVAVTAAHLMGGCRMGAGPADSVTDAWGRVHGVPWLFVADASLMPDCAGINPYVTIMALAGRTAQRVRETAGELLGAAA